MANWGISRLTSRPALVVAMRYGLVVASVATVLGTTLILRQYNFLPRLISHFTLIAIAVTFWYLETGPSLLAFFPSSLGMSLLARHQFLLPGFPLESFIIFYAVLSLLVRWFLSSFLRAEQLLTESRNSLEPHRANRADELTSKRRRCDRLVSADNARQAVCSCGIRE